jgi:hypothetical protein
MKPKDPPKQNQDNQSKQRKYAWEVETVSHDCYQNKVWDNRHQIWYCCVCKRRM